MARAGSVALVPPAWKLTPQIAPIVSTPNAWMCYLREKKNMKHYYDMTMIIIVINTFFTSHHYLNYLNYSHYR